VQQNGGHSIYELAAYVQSSPNDVQLAVLVHKDKFKTRTVGRKVLIEKR
jgi:hypothetical protein